LDVSLNSFGNSIKIKGKADAVKRTQSALEDMYRTINETGAAALEASLIDDVVRWAENGVDAPVAHRGGVALDTWKKKIVAKTKGQKAYVDLLQANEVVFGLGPAGTGKTYVAVAKAVESLKKREVERIILSRPAVEAGERLGFLPGDMKEKVDPYLRPLYDALYDMMPADKVDRMLTSGEIEIAPLAFMRGRTLSESYVIIDEAQNTTPVQMKMVLTRLGQNSRMVITGDLSQIDLPHGQPSGLADAVGLLENVAGVGIIHLSGDDVVRHPVVARILRAYEAGQTP
jgi:phosphate starvation-inducible PhoH-like protein